MIIGSFADLARQTLAIVQQGQKIVRGFSTKYKSDKLCTQLVKFVYNDGTSCNVRVPHSIKQDPRGRKRRWCSVRQLKSLPEFALQRIKQSSVERDYEVTFSRVVYAFTYPGYCFVDQHVHHRDGNTLNDHPSNLEALTPGEHAQVHAHHDLGFFDYAEAERREMIRSLHKDNSSDITDPALLLELLESLYANELVPIAACPESRSWVNTS